MDFNRWLNETIVAFMTYSAYDLSRVLAVTKFQNLPKASSLKSVLEEVINKGTSKPLDEKSHLINFLIEHLTAITKRLKIFQHINSAFQSLLKLYTEEERGYSYLIIIKTYAKKLFVEGVKSSNLSEVINSLRIFISSCQATRPPPDSTVIGLYFALNLAFKTSFRLNNLQNFTPLLRIVNNPHCKLPGIASFPKAQQVEFRYYEGRFHIYEQELSKAEASLDIAFKLCDKDSHRNKRLVLRYLIPVKAYRGIFPTQALLIKYKLNDLREILTSIKQGNIEMFDRSIETNQIKFIKQGIYVMLESLKLLAYRNLFKRMYKIIGISQIKLSSFAVALAIAGVKTISMLEIECILVNLINKKWMKGYISSSQKTVVLSRVDPFPKITEITD